MPELLTDHWEENLLVGPWPAGKHRGLRWGGGCLLKLHRWLRWGAGRTRGKSSYKAIEEETAPMINTVSQRMQQMFSANIWEHQTHLTCRTNKTGIRPAPCPQWAHCLEKTDAWMILTHQVNSISSELGIWAGWVNHKNLGQQISLQAWRLWVRNKWPSRIQMQPQIWHV